MRYSNGNEHVYRVRVEDWNEADPDSDPSVSFCGPYDDISTAHGIITRKKNLDEGRTMGAWSTQYTVERSTGWEPVLTPTLPGNIASEESDG